MTLAELKNKITFTSRQGPYGIQIRHTATINLTAEIGVDRDPSRQPSLSEIKARLTEELLRRLYDDQQREFAELLLQHALTYPMSAEFDTSRREIIKRARRMMPKDVPT